LAILGEKYVAHQSLRLVEDDQRLARQRRGPRAAKFFDPMLGRSQMKAIQNPHFCTPQATKIQSQADDIPVKRHGRLPQAWTGWNSGCRKALCVTFTNGMIRQLAATESSWLAGYKVRILDGLHLGATEHRIERTSAATWAATLPGKALVVFDQAKGLVRDVFLTEDGQAQERRLIGRVLETLQRGELWIADRNFCTLPLMFRHAPQGSVFRVAAARPARRPPRRPSPARRKKRKRESSTSRRLP